MSVCARNAHRRSDMLTWEILGLVRSHRDFCSRTVCDAVRATRCSLVNNKRLIYASGCRAS